MTPREYGVYLAEQAPPLTEAQILSIAYILASVEDDTEDAA